MPPAKSLAKVTKQIKGKKGKINALHEHSRNARRLQRASARDDKLAGKLAERERANAPHLLRVSFLQDCLPDQKEITPYDISSIQSLVDLFLARFEEELASLKSERRTGRPPSTREVALKQQIEADAKEYASGMWIPDLRDKDSLFSLRNWTGEWINLSTMKFVRINEEGVIKESSFPPKGQN